MGQQQTEMGSAVRRMVSVLLVAALTLLVVAPATAEPTGAIKLVGGGKSAACSPVDEHHPEATPEWCVKG